MKYIDKIPVVKEIEDDEKFVSAETSADNGCSKVKTRN